MIPYIDIFAGPGGLSEGFARFAHYCNQPEGFEAKLSIEKDPVAAKTLTLRTFFHKFPDGGAPRAYYDALKRPEMLPKLFHYPEWKQAEETVWNTELGQISEIELHSRIRSALKGEKNWVLLGGPPCQAYSLVGRSRMTGLGHAGNGRNGDEKNLSPSERKNLKKLERRKLERFYDDHRHRLYREYLRIVAVHQPAVFVMENVKGILSSKIPDAAKNGTDEKIFPQIREDLSDPWKALDTDPAREDFEPFRKRKPRTYRLYSFTTKSLTGPSELSDQAFLIRSERYGVPQRRHRVIILGVRDDIKGEPDLLQPSPEVHVRHMLEALPPLRSGLSKEKDSAAAWQRVLKQSMHEEKLKDISHKSVRKKLLEVAGRTRTNLTRGSAFESCLMPKISGSDALNRWITDGRLRGVLQHETRAHMNSDLGRYLFASAMTKHTGATPKLDEWPAWLLPEHRNVSVHEETGKISATGFHDRFRVQAWNRPSTTITSHISKDGHYYIHPDPKQCRSLTVREAARLQTFPDNYFFCGNRTQQFHQVGNAVPPWLAVQLADIVAGIMAKNA